MAGIVGVHLDPFSSTLEFLGTVDIGFRPGEIIAERLSIFSRFLTITFPTIAFSATERQPTYVLELAKPLGRPISFSS